MKARYVFVPDQSRKKLHPRSERQASLGIMEAELMPTPYTPQYDSAVMVRGVSGGSPLSLHDAERCQFLVVVFTAVRVPAFVQAQQIDLKASLKARPFYYLFYLFQVNLSSFSLFFQLQKIVSNFWSSSVQCTKQKFLEKSLNHRCL